MASTKEHLNSCQKYIQNNPKKRLLWTARMRAKRDNIEFSLLEDHIIIPEFCPYLGIKLTNIQGKGRKIYTNISIDRIDSSKGYTPDNIQIISNLANRMKADATEEQLITFAEGVLKLHAKTK